MQSGLRMRIAYLGWGSLVWNPQKLEICGSWKKDGPVLPIEFARISQDGRLTLTICPGASEVRTLWVQAAIEESQKATNNLAERENTAEKNIGFLCTSNDRSRSRASESVLRRIQTWAQKKDLDYVVWSDLRPNLKYESPKDAITYLRSLKGITYHLAKEYICNTPQQIKTKHRAILEKQLKLSSPTEKRSNTEWFELRRDFENRTIYKSPYASFSAVIPNRPAAFGHVMLVSWKGRDDQDITDCGLFADPTHIRDMIKTAHDLAWNMKNCLTSNGKRNGDVCSRVYLIVQCETEAMPFHIHLIPRFKECNKGNPYLLDTELQEARWICNNDKSTTVQDGKARIGKALSTLEYHERLMRSEKWARSEKERAGYMNRILKWWCAHLEES